MLSRRKGAAEHTHPAAQERDDATRGEPGGDADMWLAGRAARPQTRQRRPAVRLDGAATTPRNLRVPKGGRLTMHRLGFDPAIKPDQVDMTVTLIDGRKLHQFIEHAVGSLDHPMSDDQLQDKFTGLAEGILPPEQTRRLMDLCWNIWDLKDAGEIGRTGAAA
jgi:hypothetical protein